ncbi:MAG TPA: metallopeptidase TldD-related protein [Thermoanaerobaculia bacterium]|jgi:TldD protein|nr:metallopeptidase TldD-related protein [Thermoanaerobaculia bacterium]
MAEDSGLTRRTVIGAGAAALAAVAVPDLLNVSSLFANTGPTNGVGYFARFGVTEQLIRSTLSSALSKGGDYADVFFQHRVSNNLSLEDGIVNRATANVALGVGVRVLKGDQTGYGFTEDITPDGLRRAALTAAAIAQGPGREGPTRFKVMEAKPNRYPVKVRWEDIRPQQKLAVLNGLNEKTFKADPRVRKVNLGFTDQGSVMLVADSTGRIVEDAQPMTTMYLSIVAEQDGRRENNNINRAARADIGYYTPERLARMVTDVIGKTMVLFDAVQPPAGEMPVVMAAGAAGILLHEAIGHGMEADFNRKNVSIYSDKIGKPVAKPFVNIVDEGTQEGARGALNVDDEGNAVGRTMLVEGGTLTSYLHDSISAKHYGVKPTGNGRRQGYEYSPMPRMRSTYMLPGPHKPDEILASVKKGIYCELFSNGQVNIGAGDFTFYVKNGYLIEDGKLTKPIKDVNIIGNGPKVLELIDMVGDDLKIDEGGWTCGKDGQSVPVSQGLPTVRVSAITVGGRAEKKG